MNQIKSQICLIKAVVAYRHEIVEGVVDNVRTNRKEKRYEKMIAKSQKKIGPYVPVSYTEVWA